MGQVLKITDPRTGEVYRVPWNGPIPDKAGIKRIVDQERLKKSAAPQQTVEEPSMLGQVTSKLDEILNLPKQPLLAAGAKIAGTPKLDSFGEVYKNILGVTEDYPEEQRGLPPGMFSEVIKRLPGLPQIGDIAAKNLPRKVAEKGAGAAGEIFSDPLAPVTGGPGRAYAAAGGISSGLHSIEAAREGNPLQAGLYAALALLGARGARAPKAKPTILTEANAPPIPQGFPAGRRGSIPPSADDAFQPDVFTVEKSNFPPRPNLPALPPGTPTIKPPPLPPGQGVVSPVQGVDPFANIFPQPQTHAPFPEGPLNLAPEPLAPEITPFELPSGPELDIPFNPPEPNIMEPARGGTASRSGVFFEKQGQPPRARTADPFEASDAADVADLDIQVAPEAPPRLSPLDQRIADKNAAIRAAGDDLVEVYSGGDGVFWTTDPQRAASYGNVKAVKVPRSVFEAGKKEASRLGQPTSRDTVLPNEWANKAQPRNIAPEIFELTDEGDDIFKELGITRHDPKGGVAFSKGGRKGVDPKNVVEAFLESQGATKISWKGKNVTFTNKEGQVITRDITTTRFGKRFTGENPRATGLAPRQVGVNPRSELLENLRDPKVAKSTPLGGAGIAGMTVLPRKATPLEKATDILNIPRTLKSTADISMPLRQGLLALAHNSKQGFKNIGASIKAAFSEDRFDEIVNDVLRRPGAGVRANSGLAITVHPKHAKMGQLSHREEAFLSTLPEKIPGLGSIVRGSNRAAVAFLDKMRADIWDEMVVKFKKTGDLTADVLTAPTDTDRELLKHISRYTNMITGRGSLGKKGEQLANAANALLFSPRLISSRVQSMGYALPGASKAVDFATGRKGAGLDKRLVSELRKDWAKLGLGFSAAAGMASLLPGVKIETDPRSADFLKMKYKNTRIDLGGGFLQYITAGSRAATRKLKTPEGQFRPTGGREGVKNPVWGHTQPLFRFAEGKLNPPFALGATALKGKNFVGVPFDARNPWHWGRELTSMMTPITPEDMAGLAREHDPLTAAMLAPLGIFGAGVETYDPTSRKQYDPDAFEKEIKKFLTEKKNVRKTR